MPRDGLSQYAPPPGTNGITNYTIESTKYNGFVADVTQDLNLPRPIVAGGTGASTARDAMINLGGEIASQIVDNYDTFPFLPGSFYSDNTAGRNAPVNGHAFTGIVYGKDASNLTVEARDLDRPLSVPLWANVTTYTIGTLLRDSADNSIWRVNNDHITGAAPLTFAQLRTAQPTLYASAGTSALYIREKKAGTWSAWFGQAGTLADLDASFVNTAGDTMTGALTISATTASTSVATGALTVAGGVGVGGTVTAANVVSNAAIVAGAAGATGIYYFGNTGTKSLIYDGTNFGMTGGNLAVGGGLSCGAVGLTVTGGGAANISGSLSVGSGGAGAASYALVMNGSTGAGTSGAWINWQRNGATRWFEGYRQTILGGTSDNMIWYSSAVAKVIMELNHASGWVEINQVAGGLAAPNCALKLTCAGGGTQYGIGIQVVADNTNAMAFYNGAGVYVGSIALSPAATAFNTSSSAELKEDLKSFDAGNIIDDTEVYDFKWKSTGERAYGVIAQQAVEVYPTAVTHSVQTNTEGKEAADTEFWGVDYSKYVPVLLQELKALRARVRDLEGRIDVKPQPA